MKYRFCASLLALAMTAGTFAQNSMMAAPTTGSTDSMMAAPTTSAAGTMMAPPATSATDSMMAAPATSGSDTMMADPKTGAMLRMAMGPAQKVLFTTLKAAEALAAKGPTVLLFAADWCPTCQADLKELNTSGSRLGNITVVVVDYDKAADLKARYGVTYQHSYVQIDATGKKLALWSGGGIDGILAHIARM
jgi:thiol-disulfide isomerase/thioredoxin